MPEITFFFFSFLFKFGCGVIYCGGGGDGEVEPNWKNSSFRAVRRDTVIGYIIFQKQKQKQKKLLYDLKRACEFAFHLL